MLKSRDTLERNETRAISKKNFSLYIGSRCETPIALAYQDQECQCRNGGSCVPSSNDCACPEGFEGKYCEVESNHSDCVEGNCACLTNPCPVNSTCHPKLGTAGERTCECLKGYHGEECIDDNECELNKDICGNGICINNPGSYECFCRPGYSGHNCMINVDECLSGPCKNGATCTDLINDFQCTCALGYKGKDCSINIDECASNPCSKGSTCIDLIANCEYFTYL